MNVNSLTLKGCHVPLTAFYRPVNAVLICSPHQSVTPFRSGAFPTRKSPESTPVLHDVHSLF